MLTLSKTEDCSYIEIKSDKLSDFISSIESNIPIPLLSDKDTLTPINPVNPIGPVFPGIQQFTSFTISSTINCCTDTTVTQSINLEGSNPIEWSIQFPTNTASYITAITFQNVYSGFSFNVIESAAPLLVGDYSCSIGTITGLFPIIEQWFIDNFGINVVQNYDYDSVTGSCTYTISNLPDSIVPTHFEILTSGITTYTYFNFLSLPNTFISGTSLFLTPQFYGGEVFNDGVYSVTLTYIDIDGNVITETTCFFLDCKTGCEVSTKIKELEEASNPKNATNIFLLHYTLTEGSNCGCNCDELCEIFRKLCNNLNSSSCLCGCV